MLDAKSSSVSHITFFPSAFGAFSFAPPPVLQRVLDVFAKTHNNTAQKPVHLQSEVKSTATSEHDSIVQTPSTTAGSIPLPPQAAKSNLIARLFGKVEKSDPSQTYTFAVLGDYGLHGDIRQTRTAQVMNTVCAELHCDRVISVGDNICKPFIFLPHDIDEPLSSITRSWWCQV